MRRFIAAVGLATGLAVPPVALGATPLTQLTVRLSDLPKGTLQIGDNTMAPDRLAKLTATPASLYRQQGIVLENDRSFLIRPPGMSGYVFGKIVLLSSVAKARAFFASAMRQQAGIIPLGATPIALGRIGDARYGVVGTSWDGGHPGLESFAVVRRGTYVFTCDVIGTRKPFSIQETSRIASVVDERMRAAH